MLLSAKLCLKEPILAAIGGSIKRRELVIGEFVTIMERKVVHRNTIMWCCVGPIGLKFVTGIGLVQRWVERGELTLDRQLGSGEV